MHEEPLPSKPVAGSHPNSPAASRMPSIGELLIIEVFAGSCNLSSTLVKFGFQAIAVDHTQSHQFRVMQLDLTIQHDQSLLLDLIRHQKPFLVWMAPPCGTASRARNIPAKNRFGKAFASPLRSDLCPDGLPDLTGMDLERVLSANSLYELCERIASLCDLLGLYWVIENPFDSLFWFTSWISQRHQNFPKILLHNCMFGGSRPKRTGLLANFDLTSLAILCDEAHEHAPWRSFSEDSIHFHTAEEAAYPPQLCFAIASLMSDIALHQNFCLPPSHIFDFDTSDSRHARHLLRGSVGIQPRGAQFSFLPSSFQDLWVAQSELPDICNTVFQMTNFILLFSKGLFFLLSFSLMMGRLQKLSIQLGQMIHER